jgi:hypothetical protein
VASGRVFPCEIVYFMHLPWVMVGAGVIVGNGQRAYEVHGIWQRRKRVPYIGLVGRIRDIE